MIKRALDYALSDLNNVRYNSSPHDQRDYLLSAMGHVQTLLAETMAACVKADEEKAKKEKENG